MKRRHILVASIGATVASPTVWAETFPSRAITLMSPFPAGGGGDAVARAVAEQLKEAMGVPVVVDNVPGAGATIGTMKVARAVPNGYTILMHNNGIANTPTLYPQIKLDLERELQPIGVATSGAMTLVGRADRPEKSGREVFETIRREGEKVNFGTAGPGTISHLCALLLMEKLKTRFTIIQYRGTAPALADVMGGQIDFTIDQIPAAQLQGRVAPYAVTTPRRIASLPSVETFAEAGVEDYRVVVWQGLYAPKGTPPDRVDALSKGIAAALQSPKLIQSFRDRGIEPASAELVTAQGHEAVLRAEMKLWAPILQRAGVKLD